MISITQTTYSPTGEEKRLAELALDQFLKRKDIGFFDIPRREYLFATSQHRAEEIRRNFSHLVILGIGGSAMGGKAIVEALGYQNPKVRVEFIDNIDGYYFWQKLRALPNINETHFVLVSKSGNTVETLALGNFIHQWLAERNISLSRQSTVVSENKANLLTKWAAENNVPTLEIPFDVGGRFSVLSPVGLLPAAFLGLSLEEIRQGAQWGVQSQNLIVEVMAQSLASFNRKEWITCLWSYCDALRNFGLWFQQLWAESLAKQQTRDFKPAPRVSTPMPLIGSCDQHSVLQQIAEGARDKFIFFLRVGECENYGAQLKQDLFKSHLGFEGKNLGQIFAAQALATAQGLAQIGVHSMTFYVDKLGPKSLAAMFMFFQMVVAGLGEMLNIDAFNQPGVELGKRLAKHILQN